MDEENSYEVSEEQRTSFSSAALAEHDPSSDLELVTPRSNPSGLGTDLSPNSTTERQQNRVSNMEFDPRKIDQYAQVNLGNLIEYLDNDTGHVLAITKAKDGIPTLPIFRTREYSHDREDYVTEKKNGFSVLKDPQTGEIVLWTPNIEGSSLGTLGAAGTPGVEIDNIPDSLQVLMWNREKGSYSAYTDPEQTEITRKVQELVTTGGLSASEAADFLNLFGARVMLQTVLGSWRSAELARRQVNDEDYKKQMSSFQLQTALFRGNGAFQNQILRSEGVPAAITLIRANRNYFHTDRQGDFDSRAATNTAIDAAFTASFTAAHGRPPSPIELHTARDLATKYVLAMGEADRLGLKRLPRVPMGLEEAQIEGAKKIGGSLSKMVESFLKGLT